MKRQDRSAGSASPTRSPASELLPAPPLPRPQHLAFLTVHHPAPSEPASETSSALLSEISSSLSQREDVNRKCYASLDTKGPMKLPSIPFAVADKKFPDESREFYCFPQRGCSADQRPRRIFQGGWFLDSSIAQTADAPCSQLRVSPLSRTGDEDEADGSGRLRQSRS